MASQTLSFNGKASKRVWTKEEKARLRNAARQLRHRLGRRLRASDLASIRIPRRSPFAVKSQGARMNLYRPTRVLQPWSVRETHMLVVLGSKRALGARSIKKRGFFTKSKRTDGASWRDRSLNSIAQKMRREGYVDPQKSLRAKIAHRLSPTEQHRLKRELSKTRNRKTTEAIAAEFGVTPSTVRRYRQKWGVKFSWHDAMALPQSIERRQRLKATASVRSLEMWRVRKERLLRRFERLKRTSASKGKRQKPKRQCAKCHREWPESRTFFAPSPKRREGKLVRVYLRRSCRVCHRRERIEA